MDRFKNCKPTKQAKQAKQPKYKKQNTKPQTMKSGGRWSKLDSSNNPFLRRSSNDDSSYRRHVSNTGSGHRSSVPPTNTRFTALSSENSDTQNAFLKKYNDNPRRKQFGRRNNRSGNRISRPKRSKDEFLDYMKKKHNSTQKKMDVSAFMKPLIVKEKKKKTKTVPKSEPKQEYDDVEIDDSVKMSILNSYQYQSYSEEEESDEEIEEQQKVMVDTNNVADFSDLL